MTPPFLLRMLALLLGVLVIPATGLSQATDPESSNLAPLRLSVEEVGLMTLQNNRDLSVRRLDPIIVGTFEEIERGAFSPELFAETEFSREQATETARSTGTQFSVDGKDAAGVVGLRKFLSIGTAIEGTLEQSRSVSNRSPEQQVARVGLTLTQALLQGRGSQVNLAAVRQAELGTLASRYELAGFIEVLLSEAEIAYWNYVLAKEEIAIFESSLAIARQGRDEIELRIEVGLLPRIEAAAARAEVALREQQLIDARSLLEERRLRLLRLISPDLQDGFDRPVEAVSDPRTVPVQVKDLADRLRLAEQQRPDLNEARLQFEQQRLQTVVTRNGLLPRLDFFISLGKTGYADKFGATFRELDGNTYDAMAGIRLSHFLGNREAKARDLAARSSHQQAREAMSNLQQLVHLDVRLAVNEIERARQQISASAATRALQEQTLAAERERFEVGASTALLVAQAQRDLLASQISEVEAIVNYRIAVVNLFLAEGTLGQRRGISLKD